MSNAGQYVVRVKWGRETDMFPNLHGPYRTYEKAQEQADTLMEIGERYSEGEYFEYDVEVLQMIPGPINFNRYADLVRDELEGDE